jgi:signal transduction histidine kinase
MLLFQRLRYRITLLAVLLLIVLYSISSIAVYAIVRGNITRGLDATLKNSAVTVLQNPPTLNTYRHLWQSGIYVLPDEVQLQFIVPPNANAVIKALPTASKKQEWFSLTVGDNHYRIYYLPVVAADGSQTYIATMMSESPELQFLTRLKRVILTVGLGGLAVAILVGFFLAERMLRPIRNAWQRQLEFVSDASHELRTPLAVIQSNLGIVMEHTDESVIENLEWLNNAHGESRRLSKLVQDLLTLARSDSERMPIEQETVNLKNLVEHVHELYETIAEMKDITLAVHAPENVEIIGDRDRLHQLLVILLDNAMKFTEAGERVEIKLNTNKNLAVLTVEDTGLGIAKENIPRVFDRFFTVDPSRSREYTQKGTGLGLSIARWIVDAHRGRIALYSEGLGHGTTVKVELPIGAPHPSQDKST